MSELPRIPVARVRATTYAAEPGNPCVVCGKSVGVSAGHLFLNGSDIVPIGSANATRATVHIAPCVEPDHPELRPYVEEMNAAPATAPKAKREKKAAAPIAGKGIRAYTLDAATGAVAGFRTVADAEAARAARGNEAVHVVSSQADLAKIPGPVLVKVFNFAANAAPEGEPKARPIVRFSDAETAARRVWPAIEYLGEKTRGTIPESPSTSEGDTTMATKTKRAGAKKATTKKAPSAERGRPSSFVGKTIQKLENENPCNEGSLRYKAWEKIKNGMKVETFLADVGDSSIIRFFLAKKYIKLA